MRNERIVMQLVALFPHRAAADRARIRLIESGIAPGCVLTVDDRTEDFLIEDEESESHMSFWAHVNTMLESEREMSALKRKLRRGACVLGVRAPEERLPLVASLLESTGARSLWMRGVDIVERDDRCSSERLTTRPRGTPS